MVANKHPIFSQSIRGKIIISSVIACITLLSAWGVSKMAFKQMLKAVDKISAPNDKLRLVNALTHKVVRLDQLQKSEMLNNPANYYGFFRQTKKLISAIDSLKTLYTGDDVQVSRINSLKKLLTDRDKLFINYLNVREKLINNQAFSKQVKLLNEMVDESTQQNNSDFTITEKKTSTTTIVPEAKNDSTKESRGFLSKLFGKKKQPVKSEPVKVVDEEFNVKQDTLAKAKQDSILKGMGVTMRRLEKSQLRRSALFVNKEQILNKANNKLVHRILGILKQVEAEAVAQMAVNNNAAKNVVSTSVKRISYIILSFLVLTILLLYFILRDISRSNKYRKQIELARDEAEYHGQAKHRFLSNMSHEIRTPLQSIIGYAELIKQQELPRKSDINAIYQSAEHLMQIVNEVLDYNRIISGKFTFTNELFNMALLLNEVVSVLRFQATEKSIRLITDYHIPATEYIEADPFRLKQVLYNILGNAIKFTDEGEVKLTVLCEEADNKLTYTFKISDTGIGLSDKDISKIFNEFEQAQKTGSDYLKGTGLGLTISKALIESQGGSIGVESTPGRGSTFTFDLSYRKATEKTAQPETQLNKLPNARNGKVWIIDDDTFILELCSILFQKNGIKHRCFISPAEVLNVSFDHKVKYILIDMRMPEISGPQVCKLLKERVPADVLIFALTAEALPGERELILAQGFDGLLTKPFKEHDLIALVTPPTDDIEQPAEISLDISKIEKMTFGDKRQLNRILKRFIEDCIDDIAELRLSMGHHDRQKLLLLLHRIAGRTAQMGATELATDFRAAEINFLKDEQLDAEKTDSIILLTDKLQTLVKQVRIIYLNDDVPEAIF